MKEIAIQHLRNVAFCLLLVLALPVRAGPILFDTWLQFAFTNPGAPATGCDPADPAGPFCIGSSGTPTQPLDAPPWTFTSAGAVTLIVTDAFESGDRFEVFDFGVSLGLTSLSNPGVDCGDDPVPCLANAAISSATFLLAAGLHSITIVAVDSPGGFGVGYLMARADGVVSEPSTLLLLGLALLALKPWRRGAFHRSPAIVASIIAVALFASAPADAADRFVGPTSSQPLTLTADGAFLAVANADNNTVSVFDLRFDRNRKLAEIPVQQEPNGVAFTPNGTKLYVTNTVSGTVSVIPLNIPNGFIGKPTKHIPVGTEPYGIALTPNGTKAYVTNSRSHDVSVINTLTDTVIRTIPNVGIEPRGIAISNDGDGDDVDEHVYVTQFLALPIPGRLDGADNSKAGHVTVISALTDNVLADVMINPIADTGFKANGDALARIPPGASFTFTTGAYPNLLNNLAIKGNFVFLPNTGSSPNGPVRFDVNTHSLLSALNRTTNLDANTTINMHKAVADQTATPKLFVTQPWAVAFRNNSNFGYVASAASDVLVKVAIDPATGAITVQNDPTNTGRVLQIPTGRNPRGIALNPTDTRAYVMNFISRDITVINLASAPKETVLGAPMRSAALPAPGTLAERIHIGKDLYNASVGVFDPPPGSTTPITGRMSNNGWGACSACHGPSGLSDNVVWIFAAGPRRTIPQHGDFVPGTSGTQMRMLNWSANRDEQEDFELNIRGVSGGAGLIVLADGITPDTNVADFVPLASGGRNQLKVRGVPAWDAIKAWVQFGIRAPRSPIPASDPDVIAGRALFTAANCQQCHGGASWTTSRVRYTPPPNPAQVVNGQLFAELRNVGTFNPAIFNEVRANGAPPLGADGFVPPSLLSIHAFPRTFFHNGIALSLDEVMLNVTHRSAGTSGVDTLTNPADRTKVVRFLRSIDAATTPIF